MPDAPFADAYCGPAPVPAELWARWNGDPVLLAALLGFSVWILSRRDGRLPSSAVAALFFIAFVSPLCALSSALFSARVIHHLLIMSIAAPLIAAALPRRRPAAGGSLLAATLLQTLVLWLWHAPAPYAWALGSDAAYWLMEASLVGAAVVFWRRVGAAPPLEAGAALLFAMMQMGLLGALITFAGAPLYAPHLATTAVWGLTALGDQQLAGLIMWAPGAALYLLPLLVLIGRELGDAPKTGAAP